MQPKSKLRKSYFIMSFVFAVVVLIIALTLSMDRPESMADTSSDMITGLSNTDSSDGLTDATSIINNDPVHYIQQRHRAVSTPIKALLVLTIISLAPSILIMMTSYTKNHHRAAFPAHRDCTQTAPLNQFRRSGIVFDIFIMWPTFQQINEDAIQPLDNGDITVKRHLRQRRHRFMTLCNGQTQEKDLHLFAILMEKIIRIR